MLVLSLWQSFFFTNALKYLAYYVCVDVQADQCLSVVENDDESLFELISRAQGQRIDDQRCSLRYLVSPVSGSGLCSPAILCHQLVVQVGGGGLKARVNGSRGNGV